jgi:hypothetical protein
VVAGLKAALRRLERKLGPRCEPGTCDWPYNTVIIEPGETVPDDALCCPRCGEPHVLVLHHVVVEANYRGPGIPGGAS